jgi:hypothetical protein
MKRITVLVPASARLSADEMNDMQVDIDRRTGLALGLTHVPSAALLPQILERSTNALAWAPSYVAFVLGRMRLATPLLTVMPREARARSSVLVGRPGIEGITALSGRRVGWVSPFSTTGYDLPRLYLESFGVDADSLFGARRFCGSHTAAAEALARGEVDVIATHSRALRRLLELGPARRLASVGPVPADVLVAGSGVQPGVRARLLRGLHSLSIGPYALGHVRDGHLDLYDSLRRCASGPAPRRKARLRATTTQKGCSNASVRPFRDGKVDTRGTEGGTACASSTVSSGTDAATRPARSASSPN